MRALFFICLIGLCADPCAKKEFAELEKKALNSDSKGAIPIYRTLHQCQPENVDILFYLGRALARQHQWAEAEKYLKKCLEIDPQYHDAIIQLINLYIWQGKLEEAENLCKRNPCDTVEDKECCARIAFFQGNLKKSNTIYREILEE